MSRPVAWVTGAAGLIGSHVVRLAERLSPEYQVRALTRQEVDLTDHAAVRGLWQKDCPQLVIHCAAMGRAAECQTKPAAARKINVDATGRLADLAAESRFIFFSTDLVFDGRQGNYDETAGVNPLTLYAETKVAAEQLVLRNPRHTVLRVSLNAGQSPTRDRAFNEQMRRVLAQGECVKLFADEFRCPLPAAVTAEAVWALAGQACFGLYHLGGSERLSRWDIGQLLVARWGLDPGRLVRTSLRDFSGLPRAADVSLNCGKIQKVLPFALPKFTAWLAEHPEANL